MAEETTYYGLLEDIEKYLEYQRDEGVQRLEVDRAVLLALAKEPEVETVKPLKVETVPIPEDFQTLEAISDHISACTNCTLCETRNATVPGEGRGDSPDIMFIGEGPGAEEDAQGRPFVGKAGQLLEKMIEAMGYTREQVFIGNVVKCRPPKNRKPLPEEMEMCLPYLRRQIKLIQPKVIVGLGGTAMEGLLGRPVGITRIRGVWHEYAGIRLMPTFHPSYLLRDPSKKKDAWADLKLVLAALSKEPPPRK
ncbi:uracil-DNA glycosylase [Pontiella agarivorans]|uniref:Type-4 uracil-DNA glycosylase n=1 Tax=Pontiella agarivorans TaxID=3038953 RepID=A0ABU5MVP0_9BACT|nr:uracil-DNA glycosylase [Pontiella agarivorans]MDZ8118284.1 uracil-DNA glycosylase [Pontiella agarivorans]